MWSNLLEIPSSSWHIEGLTLGHDVLFLASRLETQCVGCDRALQHAPIEVLLSMVRDVLLSRSSSQWLTTRYRCFGQVNQASRSVPQFGWGRSGRSPHFQWSQCPAYQTTRRGASSKTCSLMKTKYKKRRSRLAKERSQHPLYPLPRENFLLLSLLFFFLVGFLLRSYYWS